METLDKIVIDGWRARALGQPLRAGIKMPDYEKIAESVRLPNSVNAEQPEIVIPAENVAAATREYLPLDHPKYQGLAAAKGYDQEGAHNRLQRVHYSHEAMIEAIILNPTLTQRELAKQFGKSEGWISIVMGSDAFQAALAKRRDDVTDPAIFASVEERFRGLAIQSLEVIQRKLESTQSTDLAVKGLDVAVKALGFGARSGGNGQTNQFIIQLPPKMENSSDWANQHDPMKRIGNG